MNVKREYAAPLKPVAKKELFSNDEDTVLAARILNMLTTTGKTHCVERIVNDLSVTKGIRTSEQKVRYILEKLMDNELVTRQDNYRMQTWRFQGKKKTVWNKAV